MKRSLAVLLLLFLASAALESRAQVAASATSHFFKLQVGAEGSIFQPDMYLQPSLSGTSSASTSIVGTSPNRLYGVGVYVDADFKRWIQIEAEGRWLRWNQYLGNAQSTYMIGPRIPIHTYKGLTPYGKLLVGLGTSSNWLDGPTFAWAYGAGLDYRLNRKFTLRCVDFEYQQWLVTNAINPHPYGGSVGLSYRIF